MCGQGHTLAPTLSVMNQMPNMKILLHVLAAFNTLGIVRHVAFAATPACLADSSCSGGVLTGMVEEQVEEEEEELAMLMGPQLLQTKQRMVSNDTVDSHRSSNSCMDYPFLCQSPLHCQEPLSEQEMLSWNSNIATVGGGPNFRLWCHHEFAHLADSLVQECLVKGDLKKSAHALYEAQKTRSLTESDASYCFREQLCSVENVTTTSSVSDGISACDGKYGRHAWTAISLRELSVALAASQQSSELLGFSNSEIPRLFAHLSCAMGSFHCDVSYCQQTYCKMPEYINKYGYLLRNKR